MLWSNLLGGLPSWVSNSDVLPTRANFFLQRNNSTGQPVGGHAGSSQVVLL
jgi:hypothetical protein